MILDSNQVVVNGAGEASYQTGPQPFRRWRVRLVTIATGLDYVGVTPPQCTVYRNAATPANVIDATRSGQRNASGVGFDLLAGESVLVKWTGATAADKVSAIFEGDDVPDSAPVSVLINGQPFADQVLGTDTLAARLTGINVSADLYTKFNTSIVTGASTPIMDVRQWPVTSIFFNLTFAINLVDLIVEWFADPGGTVSLGQFAYRTNGTAPIVDDIINVGPYIQISAAITGAGSPFAVRWMVRGKTHAAPGQGYGTVTPQTLIDLTPLAMGAGTSRQDDADFVQRGWATLACISDGFGMVHQVQTQTSGGAYIPIADYMIGAAGAQRNSLTIAIPSQRVRLVLFNSTAAPITAGASLTLGPG